MGLKSKFPRELLEQKPQARYSYFKSLRIEHPEISRVASEILDVILEHDDLAIINLVGPTGVGKTTAQKYVIKCIYEIAMPDLVKRPGWIPAARMKAPNPHKGIYDWRDHFVRTLQALDEVLIDRKIVLPDSTANQSGSEPYLPDWKKIVPPALRIATEKAFKFRELWAFFIDEAQHLTRISSGSKLINQTDTIKSIADLSHTLYVLGGTYELIPLMNLNGQLGRRSHTVHFSRYKIDEDDDIKSFIGALKSLLAYLPLPQTTDLSPNWDFFYERSMGCIGILKNWFSRSLRIALKANCSTITLADFKKSALPLKICLRIAQEIRDGEEKLAEAEDEQSVTVLREYLGMGEVPPEERVRSSKSSNVEASEQALENTKKSPSKKRNGKRRPFEPKPERYPIGINNFTA